MDNDAKKFIKILNISNIAVKDKCPACNETFGSHSRMNIIFCASVAILADEYRKSKK